MQLQGAVHEGADAQTRGALFQGALGGQGAERSDVMDANNREVTGIYATMGAMKAPIVAYIPVTSLIIWVLVVQSERAS